MNGTIVIEGYLKPDMVLEGILKCRRKNRQMSSNDLREVARGIRSLSDLITRLYFVDNPVTISHQYIKIQSSQIVFRKKAIEVLEALYDKYILILCSDTTGIAKEVVRNLDISRYFKKIFYSCDLGFLKSEEIFWTNLLSHFPEAKPPEFLVIGDNLPADIYYPNHLHMHTIKIENPLKLSLDYRQPLTNSDEEKPEYNVKELEEILPLLNL